MCDGDIREECEGEGKFFVVARGVKKRMRKETRFLALATSERHGKSELR